jgi:hypothetical protein
MKTSSKVFFILGALTAVGTMTLVCCAIQNSDKSPEKLLKDSKRFIKRSAKKAEHLIDDTTSSIKKEAKSIIKEASELL